MAQTASELEKELYALIGKYPGYPRLEDDVWTLIKAKTTGDSFEIQHNRQVNIDLAEKLIRQWIIAKGVDEKHVWTMTQFSLGNAYRGGDAYLARIGKDDKRGNRIGGPVKSGRAVPIDLLNQPIGGPDEEAPAPVIIREQATISESQLKRVAEGIISDKIDAAQRQLNMLRSNLQAEMRADTNRGLDQIKIDTQKFVESLGLGDHMTDEIIKISKAAAEKAAIDMLPHRIELKFPNGDIKQLGTEIRHEKFERVLKWLIAGCHVYIVGQKGTGKTHMAEQLRDALRLVLDREDYDVLFIDQSLTKYDVKGFKGPTGEYVGTLVRECVEKGWLMFIDEGDMWAAAALGALNSILANNVGSFPDKVVKVHKDFRCVLAANTTGHGATQGFVGRQPLDAASLDRFRYVTMGYDKNMERQIYGGQNDAWMEYVWRLRDACHSTGNSDCEPSMRAIDAGIKGLAVGLTIDEVMEDSIWKGIGQDKINKILHAAGDPPRPRLREVA